MNKKEGKVKIIQLICMIEARRDKKLSSKQLRFLKILQNKRNKKTRLKFTSDKKVHMKYHFLILCL